MEDKLQEFLNLILKIYGDFPSRQDIMQKLFVNLQEKYRDFMNQGMNEKEAYEATINSFCEAEKIMEHIPHSDRENKIRQENDLGFYKTIKGILKRAKEEIGLSKLTAKNLMRADLMEIDLVEANFSYRCLI
jgi:hypothetical protein